MSPYTFTAAAFVVASVIVWAPEWTHLLLNFLREKPVPSKDKAEPKFRFRPPQKTEQISDNEAVLIGASSDKAITGSNVVNLFQAYGARNRRIHAEVERLTRASQLGCKSNIDPRLMQQAKECNKQKAIGSPFDRARYLSKIVRSGKESNLAMVLQSLHNDESPYVRAVTASLLRHFSGDPVIKALKGVENADPSKLVRQAAKQTLLRLAV